MHKSTKINERPSHFINGKWIHAGFKNFNSINPATEEILWQGTEADLSVVDLAVTTARKAFESWAMRPLKERIEYLKAFQNILTKEKLKFSEVISKENGKPLWDSLNEVSSMIQKVDISIDSYNIRCKELKNQSSTALSVTRHKPHGVMGVLGPFNFPGHIPNGHIIPALLAGNTIVFKPSELTPMVAELMMQYFEASQIPDGVINLIQGGKETGKSLTRHDDIDGILFTGSFEVGKKIAETLSQTPYKILALEMGGNNPLIIANVKDLKAAAYRTVQSAFLSSGQRCTCARRLIVLEDVYFEFIKILTALVNTIKIGAYTDQPEPFMGPVINKEAAIHLMHAIKELKRLGGKPLVELKQLNLSPSFLTPGIIDMSEVKEERDIEYFGPLLQVYKVNNLNEAILLANKTSFGLTAGIFSDNREDFDEFYKKVRAGIINWNTPLTGASSSAPFGGVGKSGNNRPSAFYAADYCSYPVASMEATVFTTTKLPGIGELPNHEDPNF